MFTPLDFTPYPWMQYALEEYGQREVRGRRSNARIDAYLRSVGQAPDDEIAWCSAFTNWCMEQVNIMGTGRPNARSWLDWGSQCIAGPAYGAVTILTRGNPRGWKGHVGFCVGQEGPNLLLLGGNQDNSVSIKPYAARRLLGYRLPVGYTPHAL
jgi:uncharacterized protein (TIGR02594 family)